MIAISENEEVTVPAKIGKLKLQILVPLDTFFEINYSRPRVKSG